MMEELISRFLKGEAIQRLAKESGIPYGTLHRHLTMHGQPKRKQGQNEAYTPLERFNRFWMADPNGKCWLWQAFRDRHGYGRFWINGRKHTAQRASWMLLRGSIPDGYEIDHLCLNPSCVNPDHLRVVTKAENLVPRRLTTLACSNGHPWTVESTQWENVKGRRVRRCKICRTLSRSKEAH